MHTPSHPSQALFQGETPFPVLPACEHIAGSEKLISKAFQIQRTLGPVFDITCDCEDGAPVGGEGNHAAMVAELIASPNNPYGMAGARIHDYQHPHWRQDVELLLAGAGHRIAYITLPKPTRAAQIAEMVEYIEHQASRLNIERRIPIHVLIETHGALREAWEIATMPAVQVLDFGLMDFVSDHHGAIPGECMRSPGQFEHHLLQRAKSEIVAAALANSCVPSHNVTLDLKSYQQTFDDAKRARTSFGFLRMWSIYPTQIEAIIDAMKPDLKEVEKAAHILIGAQDKQWGPIQYQGELQDRASYRYFWQLLQRAQLAGLEISETARERFFAS